MSFFSWFTPARKSKSEVRASVLADSGLSRLEASKPAHAGQHTAQAHHAHASQRKHERLAQREHLYAVVREAMVRAGVLSSSYKFKVLSLDASGRQYLVMVDLARGAVADTQRTAEIEALIAQSARAKYDILVTAVYWRTSEHIAAAEPPHRVPAVSQPAPLGADLPQRRAHSRPMPLEAPSRPGPLEAASRPAPMMEAPSRPGPLEPLQAEEVAAFRKALDAGVRGEQALAAANAGRQAPHNYTLLTGFEDTEMVSDDSHQLSGTQFGSLR
jgi:hypothetical protein